MSGERIETAGEYTPTTNEVRWYFANRDNGFETYEWSDEHAAMFDRWLAQVTAEAEARGAREALAEVAALAAEYDRDDAEHLATFGQHHPVAYSAGRHLRDLLGEQAGADR